MPKFKIKHITDYYYSNQVYDSINQILLYPIENEYQIVKSHTIGITHNPQINRFNDKFGNEIGIFSILKAHDYLNITNIIEIETFPIVEPILTQNSILYWEKVKSCKNDFTLKEFLEIETFEIYDEIKSITDSIINYNLHPYENAKNLSNYIFTNLTYQQGVTSIETKIDEIWKLKAGVCQDFAHLLLEMLRISNIPARYISGYICPQNHELRGEGATHAWVEIFLPEFGWIGLDPTNNCVASDRHIRLAIGRDFKDCTPIKGTFKGNTSHRLEVTVIVENIDNIKEIKKHTTYNPNVYNNSTKTKPSFVSESKTTNENNIENSYYINQQIQRQIQMQQQQ